MYKTLSAVTVILLYLTAIQTRHVRKNDKEGNYDREQLSYNPNNFDEVYDLKQNGSENLMFDVDGVEVLVAPANSLFHTFFSPIAVLAVLDEFSRRATSSLENKKTPIGWEKLLASKLSEGKGFNKNVEMTSEGKDVVDLLTKIGIFKTHVQKS